MECRASCGLTVLWYVFPERLSQVTVGGSKISLSVFITKGKVTLTTRGTVLGQDGRVAADVMLGKVLSKNNLVYSWIEK